MVCDVDMDRAATAAATESCQYEPRHISDLAAERSNCKGLPWWKLARPARLGRRRSLVDQSELSQEKPSPSSAHRLFECENVTSSGGCVRRPSSDRQSWTLGSREGTEAPSPLDHYDPESDNQATETRLLRAYGDRAGGRFSGENSSDDEDRDARRESDRGALGLPAQEGTADTTTMDSDRPSSYPTVVVGTPIAKRQMWDDVSGVIGGGDGGDRSIQLEDEEAALWESAAAHRTPSKALRAVPLSPNWSKAGDADTAATREERGADPTDATTDDDMAVSIIRPTLACTVDDMSFDDDVESAADNCASVAEPSVVYDVLAVDRGGGYCDTSVVPFPVDESSEVMADKMRAITSGQGEFLARRCVTLVFLLLLLFSYLNAAVRVGWTLRHARLAETAGRLGAP